MKWTKGRQGTGYLKKLLLQGRWPVPFDLYLLKYPVDSLINGHKDPAEGGRHFRINLLLKKATEGGLFWKDDEIKFGRLQFFRPDVSEHGVTKVNAGTRYVLSFGYVIK